MNKVKQTTESAQNETGHQCYVLTFDMAISFHTKQVFYVYNYFVCKSI